MEQTTEQIAQHYSACMDSVNLINGPKPSGFTDAEWDATIVRNKEHLELMLTRDYWTTEDLTPIEAACGHV